MTPGAVRRRALQLKIDSLDGRPFYLQIMDELRRAIATREIEAGEALPSVRALATELGVNLHTVHQAYRELEREGWVRVRRGIGTFVRSARGPSRGDRRRRLGTVAERALREAHRHGFDLDELVRALRSRRRA